MTVPRLLNILVIVGCSLMLISCDRAKFGLEGINSLSTNGDNTANGDPNGPPSVICDPLSDNTQDLMQTRDKKEDDHDNAENDGDDKDDDRSNDYVKDPVICEVPGDPEDPDRGLLGEIYYLLPQEHAAMFNGSLRNTVLSDYFTHGYVVPTNIYLTSINVSPRPWDTGFRLPDGSIVKDLNGKELYEWFAFRLDGHLRLPRGTYDFAMISDDGMKVDLAGENILLHDGVHPPTISCTSQPVSFGDNEAKTIHLEYFQGPRVEISMQLLMRPHNPHGRCKENDNSWLEIPPENYSK